MATIKARYLGDLRVESRHLASGTTLVTDAPVDNHGKGESFSPTDLACAALGSCALTIMGIEAQKLGLEIAGSSVYITKIMGADPRRIAKIELVFNLTGISLLEHRFALEKAAQTCPVCLSLGPETLQVFTFNWLD